MIPYKLLQELEALMEDLDPSDQWYEVSWSFQKKDHDIVNIDCFDVRETDEH